MRPPTRPGATPPGSTPSGSTLPGSTLLARAALALYPPSWRARYGDEVRALLDDSGGGLAAVASVAWRAVPAWMSPPRHLHDRGARMRSSLATALMAWSMLTGLGLVFAQLTEFQGFTAPGHPEVRWAYAVFDVCLALRRLQPRGPALHLAAAAAGVAAAVMAVAATAIVVAVTGLCLWARHFAGYHHGTIPGVYLALVVAATTVTLVSAVRGTHAALAET